VIITVTLNPSLDRTLEVEQLVPGEVLRTGEPLLQPGGKGVNVTRALIANGTPSIAVLPVGGSEGGELGRLLSEEGVEAHLVPVAARTRSNITVATVDGTVTKLNEPGAALATPEFDSIAEVLASLVSAGDWVVVSGSMPPGFATSQLAAIAASVRDAGAYLAVDTSGEALQIAIRARPRLIKPNRDELSTLVGRSLSSLADVVTAAREVRDRGVELVLVSLGADGAVLVTGDTVLVGESRVDTPRSPVGAGDCFLAGFLTRFAADEENLTSALLEALAWGAAAAGLPGTAVPAPADIDRNRVQLAWHPDLDKLLVST
jgi:1-phosphofructokinase